MSLSLDKPDNGHASPHHTIGGAGPLSQPTAVVLTCVRGGMRPHKRKSRPRPLCPRDSLGLILVGLSQKLMRPADFHRNG